MPWQHRTQFIDAVGGQFRQRYVQVGGPIGGHDAGPAAVGQYCQSRTIHPGARRQRLGGGEQLAHGGYPHCSGAPDGGVKHFVPTHQGTGVRNGCASTAVTAPGLNHDDRLQASRYTQATDEGARVRDALDIEQDTAGFRVQGEIVQYLAKAHVSRRAQRGDGGKPKAVGCTPIEQRGAKCARLGYQRHLSGGRFTVCEAGVEANPGPDQAQAIGSDEGDVICPRNVHDLVL